MRMSIESVRGYISERVEEKKEVEECLSDPVYNIA